MCSGGCAAAGGGGRGRCAGRGGRGMRRRWRQNAGVSWTYADVDRSEDPVGAAAWMDAMASWPSVREVKQRTLSLLDGCRPVVDIGCGVGEDVRTFGAGAIGLDASLTMLVEARDRCGRSEERPVGEEWRSR